MTSLALRSELRNIHVHEMAELLVSAPLVRLQATVAYLIRRTVAQSQNGLHLAAALESRLIKAVTEQV